MCDDDSSSDCYDDDGGDSDNGGSGYDIIGDVDNSDDYNDNDGGMRRWGGERTTILTHSFITQPLITIRNTLHQQDKIDNKIRKSYLVGTENNILE